MRMRGTSRLLLNAQLWPRMQLTPMEGGKVPPPPQTGQQAVCGMQCRLALHVLQLNSGTLPGGGVPAISHAAGAALTKRTTCCRRG